MLTYVWFISTPVTTLWQIHVPLKNVKAMGKCNRVLVSVGSVST